MVIRRWRRTSPSGDHGKILHTTLEFGDQRLTGADLPTGRYGKPQGFDVLVSLEIRRKRSAFLRLWQTEARSRCRLQETFWALRFGMVTDRFGIPWMINCEKPA